MASRNKISYTDHKILERETGANEWDEELEKEEKSWVGSSWWTQPQLKKSVERLAGNEKSQKWGAPREEFEPNKQDRVLNGGACELREEHVGMKISERQKKNKNNEEFSSIQILQYQSKRGENELHPQNAKIEFFIEIRQVYNRSMEVTSLPPSFDYWNTKFIPHSLT
jgi:hypothetical protein